MASATPSRLLQLPAAVRRAAFSQSLTPAPALFSTRTIPTPHQTTAATFPPHQRHYATTTESSTSSDSSASSSSVNATEVSHFNALASSWWDPHGSSRLLHLMNPLRHDFINRCLTQQQGGSSISEHDSAQKKPRRRYLDSIDCEPEVIGVDPTPEVIARIEGRREEITVHQLRGGESGRPCPISGPDVYSWIRRNSLTAAVRYRDAFRSGWLIGSTIARHPVSWFTTKFMAEDILRMVPRGTHDWNQYIQPWELKEWVGRQPELRSGWERKGRHIGLTSYRGALFLEIFIPTNDGGKRAVFLSILCLSCANLVVEELRLETETGSLISFLVLSPGRGLRAA
ncbi:hypothetical protein KC315_g50 [Hortaea werneckii]|nr:hypothetical protein KC315_g50 [Hortaea werneckii]